MTTFALVHGAWHDSWCWELLTPLLQRHGHDVVAPDLPGDDGSASFGTYADVVCAALDGRGAEVILVGHSLGGNTIPLVAARRPIGHLVYLCALVPDVGRTLRDQVRAEVDMLNPLVNTGLSVPDAQRRRSWADLDLARELFYADCDRHLVEAAVDRLRPQATYPYTVPFPLAAFPPVRATYVVCSDDQIIGPQWSKRVAQDRLGADIIEIPGGHSPFLSRPSHLADILLSLDG